MTVGKTILVADGKLSMLVKSVSGKQVLCEILNDFKLGEKKNCFLPGSKVLLPTISDKEKMDIVEFGVKHNVDYIALSFAR